MEVISSQGLCKIRCLVKTRTLVISTLILVRVKREHQLEWEEINKTRTSPWMVSLCRDPVGGSRMPSQMVEVKPNTLKEDNKKTELVHKTWTHSLPRSTPTTSFEWIVMQILLSILSCNRIAVAVKTLLQVESKALQLEKCVRFAMVLNVMQPLFHVDTISLV